LLPCTVYCFTQPLLDQILKDSSLIYESFHTGFQYYLLQIIGHSFNPSQENMETLMSLFKELVSEHSLMLERKGFRSLLEAIYTKTIDQEQGYFPNLESPIKILKKVLRLASSDKLNDFTLCLIQQLTDGEASDYA
jgi:hypothetical protein